MRGALQSSVLRLCCPLLDSTGLTVWGHYWTSDCFCFCLWRMWRLRQKRREEIETFHRAHGVGVFWILEKNLEVLQLNKHQRLKCEVVPLLTGDSVLFALCLLSLGAVRDTGWNTHTQIREIGVCTTFTLCVHSVSDTCDLYVCSVCV